MLLTWAGEIGHLRIGGGAWDYYSRGWAAKERKPMGTMPLLCERFDIIYPKLATTPDISFLVLIISSLNNRAVQISCTCQPLCLQVAPLGTGKFHSAWRNIHGFACQFKRTTRIG
jgi:hypothetical protein